MLRFNGKDAFNDLFNKFFLYIWKKIKSNYTCISQKTHTTIINLCV